MCLTIDCKGAEDMIRIGNSPDGMTVAEVNAYINYMAKQHPDIKTGRLDIELDGEDVELTLTPDVVRFQRIRRITGKRPR